MSDALLVRTGILEDEERFLECEPVGEGAAEEPFEDGIPESWLSER
jgi:hypothetical protein